MIREELGELVNHLYLQDKVEEFLLGYVRNVRKYNMLLPDDILTMDEFLVAAFERVETINLEQASEHPIQRTDPETYKRNKDLLRGADAEFLKICDERVIVKTLSDMLWDIRERALTTGDNDADYQAFNSALRIAVDMDGSFFNWQTTVDIKGLHKYGIGKIRDKLGDYLKRPEQLSESVANQLWDMENELVELAREASKVKILGVKEYKGAIGLGVIAEYMFKGEVPESLRGALGDQEPVVEEPDEVRQIVPQYSKKLARAYRRVAFRGEDKSQIRIATKNTLGKMREMQSQGMATYSVNEVIEMINTIGNIADRSKTIVAPVCYGMESFITQFDPNEALSVDVIDKIEYHGVPAFREKMGIWFDLVRSNFRSRYVANAELS